MTALPVADRNKSLLRLSCVSCFMGTQIETDLRNRNRPYWAGLSS